MKKLSLLAFAAWLLLLSHAVPAQWNWATVVPSYPLVGPSFTGQLKGPVTANCSAPSYSFTGDLNSGFTSTAADVLAVCAAGSSAAYYTSSGFGPSSLRNSPFWAVDNLTLSSADNLRWAASVNGSPAGSDLYLSRSAPGSLTVGTTAAATDGSIFATNHYVGSGANGVFGNSYLRLRGDTGVYGFAAGNNATAAADVGISRTAASTLAIGNGTVGDISGSLSVASVTLGGVSVVNAPSAGRVAIGNGGARSIVHQANGVPTCSSNCGTSPSVSGVDSSMTVTMGSAGSPASGFVITFNGTWAASPQCTGAMAKAGMVVGKMPLTLVTTTTTLTVVTNGTNPATTDMYHFRCTLGV